CAGGPALVVTPSQPAAAEPGLAQPMGADIVVIPREAPTTANADCDIAACKNDEYGINLRDELAKAMGEEGEYAQMVGSLSSTTHMEWVDAAKKHQEENYPNMKLVGDRVETDRKSVV